MTNDGIGLYITIATGIFVVVLLFFVFAITSSNLETISPGSSIDSSGNVNLSSNSFGATGILTSWSVERYNNTWLSFNGINNSINMSDKNSFDIYQGNFSISFWLNVNSYNNNVLPRIIEQGANYLSIMGNSSNARYGELALEMQNLTGGNTIEVWSDTDIVLNTWEHWVVVWNGTNGTWFKNGVMTNTRVFYVGGPFYQSYNNSGVDLVVARSKGSESRFLNSSIDDFRFYNTNLSNNDIGLLFNNSRMINTSVFGNSRDSNLVWYMPLVEYVGNTSYDFSGNNNSGFVNGSSWGSDSFVVLNDGVDYYANSSSNYFVITWINDLLDHSYFVVSASNTIGNTANSLLGNYTVALSDQSDSPSMWLMMSGIIVILSIVGAIFIFIPKGGVSS